ncbi:hypothetical protein [Brevundimonas sp.]|uniref:hypothetical protein n=1 Tax=Brevundimonas sp. TaxID=1871086 RepID=UPI00289E7B0E|nr:hypothetical protein [Brevundimonas sp.]
MQVRTNTKKSTRFAAAAGACVVVGWSLALVLPRQYAGLLMTLTLAIAAYWMKQSRGYQRIATNVADIPADERRRFIAQSTFWLFVFLLGLGLSWWCILYDPSYASRMVVGFSSITTAALSAIMMWKTTIEHVARLTPQGTDLPD